MIAAEIILVLIDMMRNNQFLYSLKIEHKIIKNTWLFQRKELIIAPRCVFALTDSKSQVAMDTNEEA